MTWRETLRELRELGVRSTAFRVRWEVEQRLRESLGPRPLAAAPLPADWRARLPLAPAAEVAGRLAVPDLDALRGHVDDLERGVVRGFSHLPLELGAPPRWLRHPGTGACYPPDEPWQAALRRRDRGDIKLIWELGRFPQAFALSRLATHAPSERERCQRLFAEQVETFLASAEPGFGPHWASGQEVAVRVLAWCAAAHLADPALEATLGKALSVHAAYLDAHIEFARRAVHNNHLIGEALGLFLVGRMARSASWIERGRALLDESCRTQFAADGGYTQNAHNYQRVAVDYLLWACAAARRDGAVPRAWREALAASLDFLSAHQNPVDGALPNYGANDGALPSPWTGCDYSDFRPHLQAASLLVHGVRAYPPGPWDEHAAWLLGPDALEAPLRPPAHRTRSFLQSGYHVVRSAEPGSFAAFRCGSVRSRFSQIDMLHLDVWWRGHNVFADPGSYHYNADPADHTHAMSTRSHNTVTVDGLDQMLLHRPFKCLYWTPARLSSLSEDVACARVVGEHRGFARALPGCVHRRSVLRVGADTWIVLDHVTGEGAHEVRVHWQAGPFDHVLTTDARCVTLTTPSGPFSVQVLDPARGLCALDVCAGRPTAGDRDPRGWVSRTYAQRTPAPSVAWKERARLPGSWVSVLGAGRPEVAPALGGWRVRCGARTVRFGVVRGYFADLRIS